MVLDHTNCTSANSTDLQTRYHIGWNNVWQIHFGIQTIITLQNKLSTFDTRSEIYPSRTLVKNEWLLEGHVKREINTGCWHPDNTIYGWPVRSSGKQDAPHLYHVSVTYVTRRFLGWPVRSDGRYLYHVCCTYHTWYTSPWYITELLCWWSLVSQQGNSKRPTSHDIWKIHSWSMVQVCVQMIDR